MATSFKQFIEESEVTEVDHSPNLRKEIEKKKEEKRLLESANCTFQPALIRRGRDSNIKPVAGSRFDHLYSDAIKRKTEGPKSKGRVDENMNTFKPSISPRARSISRDRKASDMVNHMYNASGAGRAIVKEVSKDTNTFKPVISKRASSLDRTSLTDTNSRLYELRTGQEATKKKQKEEADLIHAKECSFFPRVPVFRSRSVSREPVDLKSKNVFDRMLRSEEKTKSRLEEEQRLKTEKDLAEMTIRPTVAKRRLSLTPGEKKEGEEDVDVYTRLTQSVAKDFSVQKAANDIDLTFQPRMSTNNSTRDRADSIDGESVHERLYREAKLKTQELEEEVSSYGL
jgi:hypothetical protein